MPQIVKFVPGYTNGIRHADLMEGERVLKDLIYECQKSLEAIGHAKLDMEARGWARGMGLRK